MDDGFLDWLEAWMSGFQAREHFEFKGDQLGGRIFLLARESFEEAQRVKLNLRDASVEQKGAESA